MATPRCDGSSSVTSRAPISIRPALVVSSPAISRNRVDLPQPDGPTNTTNSPSSILRSTPWMISVAPNDFLTPESARPDMGSPKASL